MMLEQSAHIFLRLGPLLGAWGAPGGPLGAPKLAKMGIAGYSHPWRPQIGGTAWIYVYGAIFNIFAQKWPYGSFGT